jgi:RNA polymerase sigma factor (TIGR02999 family)
MRRILIERARRRATHKHGGDHRRLEFDQVELTRDDQSQRLLDLDEALDALERHDAQASQLVKLRYFAGLTHQQAAEALGLGRRAADRLWALARAWLYRQIADE